MIVLRSLVFQALFYPMTAIFALAGLPLLALPALRMARYGTAWSRATLWLLRVTVGLDHEIIGCENLPAGPMIVAMKHQSAWDTFAASLVVRNPALVIKRELGWIPFYGWYLLKAGNIAVDRGGGANALRGMVERAQHALAAGRPIFIFPEGTRSAVGAPPDYQSGVALLYRQLKVPLVPVAVNSGVFWGRRRFAKYPGRITAEILPAIPPGGDHRKALAELEARIEEATARLVAQPADGRDKPVEKRPEKISFSG